MQNQFRNRGANRKKERKKKEEIREKKGENSSVFDRTSASIGEITETRPPALITEGI